MKYRLFVYLSAVTSLTCLLVGAVSACCYVAISPEGELLPRWPIHCWVAGSCFAIVSMRFLLEGWSQQ